MLHPQQQQAKPETLSYLPQQQQHSFIGTALTVGTTAYGAYSARKAQKKAANQAKKAAEASQVNPEEIARIAREQSIRNAQESLALEGALTPENQALRRESTNRLLAELRGGTPYADMAIGQVAGQVNAPDETAARSTLLAAAIDRARQDLALGGELDTATRNEVTRRAGANAARVGGGRLGMGANVTARDLGLRSLDLANQRLATGGQFGSLEQSLNQQDLLNLLNQRSQRAQLAGALQNMEGARTQRYYNLAGFGQGLQSPAVGLSATDFASLYTQNAENRAKALGNAAAIQSQGAVNTGQMWGQIGGTLGSAFGGSNGLGRGVANWWNNRNATPPAIPEVVIPNPASTPPPLWTEE